MNISRYLTIRTDDAWQRWMEAHPPIPVMHFGNGFVGHGVEVFGAFVITYTEGRRNGYDWQVRHATTGEIVDSAKTHRLASALAEAYDREGIVVMWNAGRHACNTECTCYDACVRRDLPGYTCARCLLPITTPNGLPYWGPKVPGKPTHVRLPVQVAPRA